MMFLYVFITYMLIINGNARTRELTYEEKLLRDIFDGYNPEARPAVSHPETVPVRLRLGLDIIHYLDAKMQVLTVGGWLDVAWRDERLAWNSSEYGGLEWIVVPPYRVWKPMVALENAVGSNFIKAHYEMYNINLNKHGEIAWDPGGVFKSACQIDITYFPFDEQVCELVFENWADSAVDVNFTTTSDSLNLEDYTPNVEWDLIEGSSFRTDKYYDCCSWPYSHVHFRFRLARKPLFYLINVILPSAILSTLVLLVFCLPTGCIEKVGVGLTILLAYTVFSLMVTEWVPRSSRAVPLLSVCLLSIEVTVGLEIILVTMTLKLAHGERKKPPPRWLRRLVLKGLAKMLCMKYDVQQIDPETRRASEKFIDGYNENVRKKRVSTISNNVHEIKDFGYLSNLKEMVQSRRLLENWQEEWKNIAEVLERLLFIVFVLVLMGIALSFFLMAR